MTYYDHIREELNRLNFQWFHLQKKKFLTAEENPETSLAFNCWLDLERMEQHLGYLSFEDFADFDAYAVGWSIIERMQRLLRQPIDVAKKLNIIRSTIACIKEHVSSMCASIEVQEYKDVMSFIAHEMEQEILRVYGSLIEAEETGSVESFREVGGQKSSEQPLPHSDQEAVNTLPLPKAKNSIKPVLKDEQEEEFFLDFLDLIDANFTPIFSATNEEKSLVAKQLVSLFKGEAYSPIPIFQCNWSKSALDYFFRKLLGYRTGLTPKTLVEVAFIEVKGKKYTYSKSNASKYASAGGDADMRTRNEINDLFSRYTWQPTR